MKNEEVLKILRKVSMVVQRNRYAFILPEHILWVLLDEPGFIEIARYCEADLEKIRKMISDLLEMQEKAETINHIIPTREYSETIGNCSMFAQLGCSELKVVHLVLAILGNGPESVAAYSLMVSGVTEEKVNRYIESAAVNTGTGKFAYNLTEKARRGEIDPVVGREPEIGRMIRILHKKRSSNVILVANPGVGKTAAVEGLALKIANGKVPEPLKEAAIWSLDLGAMVAGTKLRGEFEERLKNTVESIRKEPGVILFIDEIHSIVGAGGSSDGALDAGNILKPYLTGGAFRCIGATTYEEYRKHILKDKALARRFRKIDLAEPSREETLQILKGLRSSYESFHGISFPDEVLETIVELADRFLPGQFFPDKAIELMDEIGSGYRSGQQSGREALREDVEQMICRIVNIPGIKAEGQEKETLRHLPDNIKKELFGQDETVDRAVRHIKLAKAGLTNRNKPLGVFGLVGSSGGGKTEFAKQLAVNLGISFLKLDMSEYSEKSSVSRLIGTSPGYVGFEQPGSLTEPLIRNPHCVVLLDEIEKADPAVYDLLLQVMDEGRLTDNNNREASFRNAVILMTSNAGCARADAAADSIGFAGGPRKDSIIAEALKKAFSPEFRNRFTEIFYFNELGKDTLELIVDKAIRHLNESLDEKSIKVSLSTEAKEFIVIKAFEEKMGGRPVERLIQRHVSEQLVDAILFDNLQNTEIIFEKGNDSLQLHIV